MTNKDALLILSELITFNFEIRGNSNQDENELEWRKKVEEAELFIYKKLLKEVA